MKQVIDWFEIPAADFDRAATFYENVFAVNLRREKMTIGDGSSLTLGIFPCECPGISGAVCKGGPLTPGGVGTLIYLAAEPDVAPVLARVAANGGRVVLDKTLVSEAIGYIGIFLDTEGNRVGVHAAC